MQTPLPDDASAPLVFSLRYWPPDAALKGLVTGYHHYMLDPGPGRRHHDVFYPAWANLRLQTAGTPWSMRIGDRDYDRLPEAAMFGPTSHASYCSSAVGALIGVGFSPLGYSRLTRVPADAIANRVVPLDTVLAGAATLRAELLAAPPEEIPAILDAFLCERLLTPRADDAAIAALHRYLLDSHPPRVGDAVAALGLPPWTVNRVSRRAFGFAPKLLLRRTRFLRSLMLLRDAGDQALAAQIGADYHDYSHFVRDAREFLGMSPREFLALPKPMNEASTRLRTSVLGAPAQALDVRSAGWAGHA